MISNDDSKGARTRNEISSESLSGVCYHCRQLVWDGKQPFWRPPLACPHCDHPLTLAFTTGGVFSPHQAERRLGSGAGPAGSTDQGENAGLPLG